MRSKSSNDRAFKKVLSRVKTMQACLLALKIEDLYKPGMSAEELADQVEKLTNDKEVLLRAILIWTQGNLESINQYKERIENDGTRQSDESSS